MLKRCIPLRRRSTVKERISSGVLNVSKPQQLPKPPSVPIPSTQAIQRSRSATYTVSADDDGVRVDRWLRNRFKIPQSLVEKLIRKRQITINDGTKSSFVQTKSSARLRSGWLIRAPSSLESSISTASKDNPENIPEQKKKEIESWVIHKDNHIIVLNKPPGLAVQGGTGVRESVDSLLVALKEPNDPSPPMLIHRLDQATSGILVLARTKQAARILSKDWTNHDVRKLYWAVTLGVPSRLAGLIKVPLKRVAGGKGEGAEKVIPIMDESEKDLGDAKMAITQYRTVAHKSKLISFMALRPRTGRTHQLRVHCASVLNTPILGDEKYGPGLPEHFKSIMPDVQKPQLHLHAREIAFLHPVSNTLVRLTAPPPPQMMATMKLFGFHDYIAHPYATFDEKDLVFSRKKDTKRKVTKISSRPGGARSKKR